MKRLAIFVGGLLVLPAFAEVAPIFIDENGAIEYADEMYDENGFLINPETEVIESEDDVVAQQTPVKVSRAPVNATPGANRTTSTRAVPTSGSATASGRGTAAGNSSRVVAARTTTSPRGDASRTVASRGTTATSPRTTGAATSTRATATTAATRAAAARTTGGATRAVTPSAGASVARTATTSPRTTAARTATATTARAATASGRLSVDPNRNVGTALKNATITAANGTVTLNDSGGTFYNKSASVRRTPTIRMSSLNGLSTETTAVSVDLTTEDLDGIAELTDYCKAQYANCMDNYCNVLDDNQGRCSCSANLKNYAKAEAALKTATEELQDVAQKIQYIGLSRREVETLFTETEAEETMRTKGTDNSQLQASLNKVKDMIINVQSGGATASTSDDILNFDLSGLLEFSFDSTGFDLASLFGTSNTNSVNNQRGEQLYKTAAARCKSSVLKACTAKGVDASLITNAYDLEIDRECMAYERSLNDSNDQMVATVRNAKNVLQKARLMVAQQKNTYDMRGCINALDACMQDEFVCGSDYENCLDPTGRYIVNGAIVVGSQPGHAIDPDLSQNVASVMTSDVCRVNLYRTWDMPGATCKAHKVDDEYSTYIEYPTADQGNAWGSGDDDDNLVAYIENTVKGTYPDTASENMSLYLQNKIGYNKDGKNYGMCMSVLNKCQDYTYSGTGTSAKYDPKNDVIKQYLGRILVQIKAKQDEVLANYAETCVSDVTSCLGQNGYPSEDPADWDPSEYSTNTTKMNIAVNACRAQIVTCMSVNGYSIDTPTPTEMNCWVQGLLYSTSTDECMIDNIHDNPCSLETISQCTQGTCKATLGPSYTWCTTGDIPSCMLESQCPTPKYNVIINCGDHGEFTGSDAQPVYPISSGSSISLNWSTYCTKDSDWEFDYWKCGTSNTHLINDYQYTPSTNNVGCTVYWKTTNPATTTYKLNIDCGNGGGFTGGTVGNNCIASGSCGQVSVISGACTNLNDFCFWPMFQSGTIPWSCSGNSLTNNDRMCPVSDGITCTANNQPSGGKKLTINCGTGTTGTNTTINLPSNNCISISSLNNYCTATNSGAEITWNCNGVSSGTSQQCFNNENNPLCTATANGGTPKPFWVTVNLKYGDVNPTRPADPDQLYVDKTGSCPAVYKENGTPNLCPDEGNIITKLQKVPASNSGVHFVAFRHSETGNENYIDKNGYIYTDKLHTLVTSLDTTTVNLVAAWTGNPPVPRGIVTVNLDKGAGNILPIDGGQTLTAVYVDFNTVCPTNGYAVYRVNPEENGSWACDTKVTNIGRAVKTGTRGPGYYINDVNGEKVLFADERGNIISENLSKLANTDTDEFTATAQFFGNNVLYYAFDTDNGTWDAFNSLNIPDYDEYYINNEILLSFYQNYPDDEPGQPIQFKYTPGTGYQLKVGEEFISTNSFATLDLPTKNGYALRGYFPKQFSPVDENSNSGEAWPYGIQSSSTTQLDLNSNNWVMVTKNKAVGQLKLYAGWAKKCRTMENGDCTLSIDNDGSVTYYVFCDNDQSPSGSGANAICPAPGSNENFDNIFLLGATIAEIAQAN